MATRGLPAWPHLHDSAEDLPEAECLILDAARAWAGTGPAGPMAAAALVLASAGAEGVGLLLDSLLRGLPGLHLACALCPAVSATEGAWLLAIGATQQGQRSLALGLLHRLAPPLGAYRTMPALIGISLALKRSGVVLTPRL